MQSPPELVRAALACRKWRAAALSAEAWTRRLGAPSPEVLACGLQSPQSWPRLWVLQPANLLSPLDCAKALGNGYENDRCRAPLKDQAVAGESHFCFCSGQGCMWAPCSCERDVKALGSLAVALRACCVCVWMFLPCV